MEENNITEEQIDQTDENLNGDLSDHMILFPKSTILRLARKNHPKLQINKDAQEALQHSASLFMSYIYTLARVSGVKNNRKTITLEEIMEALDTNGLDSLDLHQETLELLQLYTKNENKKKAAMK